MDQANYYETMSQQLQKNPILSMDYLKRAFLINGDASLREMVRVIKESEGFEDRAHDSVELLAANF